MGKRGPGAKSVIELNDFRGQPSLFGGQTVAQAPVWEAEGLTRAERVIAFCETLEVTAGFLAGQPFSIRPWQREIIEAIYREDGEGNRPVRTAVLSFGRKNGKTGLAAALALCHLAGPEAETRGEVFSAANDRNQAAKLFKEMVAMVRRHPLLNRRISERTFSKELEDAITGSTFMALSADAATKHGLSPSCVIYDELGQAVSSDLYDALNTAMGARKDPLIVVISTQAATDIAPMSQLIDYGERVNAGIIVDPSFYLSLHTVPPDSDPWDEAVWAQANPALGDFLSLDEVRRQASQARRMPGREPAFRNLILNQRVSAEKHFLTVSEWKANGEPPRLETLRGRPCYGGLDLSAVRDLTALVLVFPADDGTYDVVPRFWLPQDTLRELEEETKAPYWAWREAGHLYTTPGTTIDHSYVAAHVGEIARDHDLRCIAFDRWKIELFTKELQTQDIQVEIVPHGQGTKDMSGGVDMIERCVSDRRLRHGNHPVLMWNAANAVVSGDPAGGRKLDKLRSRSKIDGMVALAMALNVASRSLGEPDWSPMVEFC